MLFLLYRVQTCLQFDKLDITKVSWLYTIFLYRNFRIKIPLFGPIRIRGKIVIDQSEHFPKKWLEIDPMFSSRSFWIKIPLFEPISERGKKVIDQSEHSIQKRIEIDPTFLI